MKKHLNILIGCECSGVVREAFRALGHNAYSCDLVPADDGSAAHYQQDVFEVLDLGIWDMFLAHPPCQFMSVSGIHWNDRGRGWERTDAALDFVRRLMAYDIPWAIENPVSIISSRIRPPDQIIQPYDFGEDASKKTCLWLNRLPPLPINPQNRRAGRMVVDPRNGRLVERWSNQTDAGQNRLGPSATRAKERAVTYRGIASQMAATWGTYLLTEIINER